jgi:hypothetical protein
VFEGLYMTPYNNKMNVELIKNSSGIKTLK